MNDNLYTRTSNFLVSLDSRNATTYFNGSYNSDLEFNLETPIRKPKDSILFSTSILSFTAPNSIYIINEYNNLFNYSIGSINYSLSFFTGGGTGGLRIARSIWRIWWRPDWVLSVT